MLYSLKKETGQKRLKDKSTNKNKTKKKQSKRQYPPPVPPHKPRYESITPHLSHPPIIHNNNIMDTEHRIPGANKTI